MGKFDISDLAKKKLRNGQVLALLYYSGYLTIKDGNTDVITLTFPNKEISTSFSRSLVSMYSDDIEPAMYANNAKKALEKKNIDSLIEILRQYFSQFPYTLLEKDGNGTTERTFQLVFFSFFVSMGGRPVAEDASIMGRSDVVFSYKKDVYIAELKIDKEPKEAINQIKEKRYYEKYINDGKNVHILGISFDSTSRQINDYLVEDI